ncbi:MAG: hypothetical protein QXS54_11235 [Candidatus Methanomethylicaceae archaeon]
MRCPRCQSTKRRRFHTPIPKPRGYRIALSQQAVAMAADGHSNHSIARTLKINHLTVANGSRQQQPKPNRKNYRCRRPVTVSASLSWTSGTPL